MDDSKAFLNMEKEDKMKRKLWMVAALFLVVPGLLFTVSCAKKKVASEPGMMQEESEAAKSAAEKAREEELARQRALEEQRLKEAEEAKRKKIAEERARFENEDIYFEFDSATLLPMAQEILKRKSEYLKTNPNLTVIIEGHCDERGTHEYNLALGDRRAKSAMQFLMDLGVPASRMVAISYGEERPVDPGNSEEAWAKNRRAHFVIQ